MPTYISIITTFETKIFNYSRRSIYLCIVKAWSTGCEIVSDIKCEVVLLPWSIGMHMLSGCLSCLQVCENHPQGVVLVRFKDRKDARKCIEVMNGRW